MWVIRKNLKTSCVCEKFHWCQESYNAGRIVQGRFPLLLFCSPFHFFSLVKLSQHRVVLLLLLRWWWGCPRRAWFHRCERNTVEVGDECPPAATEGSVQGLTQKTVTKVLTLRKWSGWPNFIIEIIQKDQQWKFVVNLSKVTQPI